MLIRYDLYIKQHLAPQLEQIQSHNLSECFQIFINALQYLGEKHRRHDPTAFVEKLALWCLHPKDKDYENYSADMTDAYRGKNREPLRAIFKAIATIKRLLLDNNFYSENFSELNDEAQSALHASAAPLIKSSIEEIRTQWKEHGKKLAKEYEKPRDIRKQILRASTFFSTSNNQSEKAFTEKKQGKQSVKWALPEEDAQNTL